MTKRGISYSFELLIAGVIVLLILGIYFEETHMIFLMIKIVGSIGSGIPLIVIGFGMIYHEIKRKDWGWLTATILIAFIKGAGAIVAIIYYFVVMRKAFKEGNINY